MHYSINISIQGEHIMALDAYNKDYFTITEPHISDNVELRQPQIEGYFAVYDHFSVKNKKTHALVVLPTGVGKTGLMGLLPYSICKGRVLIITPQLTIKDTVIDSLDPDNAESFWLQRNILEFKDRPTLIEFDSSIPDDALNSANIVVLNIQKLQKRLEKSPLNTLPSDYFDMIIIDEAHHSPANTWVSATDHFKNAKVVKLTATPIRTDGVKLAGDLVYEYKLSQAMAKGYVKSLKDIQHVPDKLYLTIDNDESTKYTVDELMKTGLKDEDWIKRSVAYSKECSNSVVDKSIHYLRSKTENSKVPHKIIAVACSIDHAEKIKSLYKDKGLAAEVIHSKQEPEKREAIKNAIKNHRIEVIINVAMLGEGYDHPYLSIAAIFRPFKNELPYEQFVGRVLRTIPQNEVEKIDDNIAIIVSHKHLGLKKLWDKYKIEIQESEIIKHLQDENFLFEDDYNGSDGNGKVISIGSAIESGQSTTIEDDYLKTELIKLHAEEEKKKKETIEELKTLLKIDYEQARSIYNQNSTQRTSAIKRPDEYFRSKKRNLNAEITEIIVPEMITKYKIIQTDDSLRNCGLFTKGFTWIKHKDTDNGGFLAMYFNEYLRKEIGARKNWKTSDYDTAFSKLPVVKEHVDRVISEYLQK